MAQYPNGEKIHIGDKVLIEFGRTPGVVAAVIESEDEQAHFSVEEPGVMIESAPFGLVFWPAAMKDDPIIKA